VAKVNAPVRKKGRPPKSSKVAKMKEISISDVDN